MAKQIKRALVSVFYKEGLEPIIKLLNSLGVSIYSTGGTQQFIESLGVSSTSVESVTGYPSILGGRVKTLHPVVFGGILGRQENSTDLEEMSQFDIPAIDLVIVDLYPFEETVGKTADHKIIVEKIDIGGVSLIRAAAKNYQDVLVVASRTSYPALEGMLVDRKGESTLEERKSFAAKAFEICAGYDVAIADYFNPERKMPFFDRSHSTPLRYGENPHQQAVFFGDLTRRLHQLHGKEISYNNLVDIDAALQLIGEFNDTTFAIIKHTNPCGIASRDTVSECWKDALAGDPESAFGGVLVCNATIDKQAAEAISEIFFEVLLATQFTEEALAILETKKNRILLQYIPAVNTVTESFKSLLGGVLVQNVDAGNYSTWQEVGGTASSGTQKTDLIFANIVCKHLKSNAIALVKNRQLVGKGCGQTSRVDALRNAIDKARQFGADLRGAVLASDAFFPFDDCVRMAHAAGITAFIQPGGSVRDKDSIQYCVTNKLSMVITTMRHFRH